MHWQSCKMKTILTIRQIFSDWRQKNLKIPSKAPRTIVTLYRPSNCLSSAAESVQFLLLISGISESFPVPHHLKCSFSLDPSVPFSSLDYVSHNNDIDWLIDWLMHNGCSSHATHSTQSKHIATWQWRFSDNDSRLFCFPVLTKTRHMTRVLPSPFTTTVWTPVVLAITKHYLGHVKNVYDDDDEWWWWWWWTSSQTCKRCFWTTASVHVSKLVSSLPLQGATINVYH